MSVIVCGLNLFLTLVLVWAIARALLWFRPGGTLVLNTLLGVLLVIAAAAAIAMVVLAVTMR